MTDVPFLPAARAEMLRAAERYEKERPGLSRDYLAEVETAAQRIATFPEHGSPFLQGTRRVVLKRFPFSVVYSTEADGPLVVAIAHHRRRPGYWVRRMKKRPGG